MKKIVLIILSIAILIGGGVGLAVGLKDKNTEKLDVKIYDLTVKVGHNKAIEYECSNENAIISFEIENEDVAQVEYVSQIPTVIGMGAGTTTITIRAKYKRFSNEKSATVTVTNDDSEEEEPSVSFEARKDVTVDGNVVTCTSGVDGYVTFVPNNINVTSWSVSTEDENIAVSKCDFPQTIQISSDVAGEYTIKLTINGTHEIEINVIVNE